MASDEIALVLSHRPENHHPQLLFRDDSNLCNPLQHHQILRPIHHSAGLTFDNNNSKTTRELTGFIEHQNRDYQSQATTEFRRSMCEAGPAYNRGIQDWDVKDGRDSSSQSGDGSDINDNDEDENDDDMDDGNGDGHVVGFVNISSNNMNDRKIDVNGDIIGEKNDNGKRNHPFSIRNDINDVRSSPMNDDQQGQLCQYQNAVTIADPNGELYYSQYRIGVQGSGAGFKDMLVENGCGFSGRKDISNSGGSGESLRKILSDPLTGALMDDAIILRCGHSFGSRGMQHVMRMKACYTCSHPVSEGSVAPNLSLQSAVHAFLREEELRTHHAFLREEELRTHRASKRKNRSDQDKSNYGDSALGRGILFPFCVTERVIIKGNKRTPPRFVGREAVVTSQCLNGWLVFIQYHKLL